MVVKYSFLKKIKNIKFVRILSKPWMDIKLQRIYQNYLKTEDSQKMKTFKNTYVGERCFIIGNGPSLTAADLDKLQNEYTFSSNRIYEMFDKTAWRPWTYLVSDIDIMRQEHEIIRRIPCTYRFVSYEAGIDTEQWEHTVRIHGGLTRFVINRGSDLTAIVKEDVSQGFSNAYTVTFVAIQLAIYMGFKEIYLLGVDASYSTIMDKNGKTVRDASIKDYFNPEWKNQIPTAYEPMHHGYKVAREYCETHGIVIKNATRGGKLEVLKRVDFDTLFA